MNAVGELSADFLREHVRVPLTLALLAIIPIFFVLIFASVLGDFAQALGGDLAEQAATAISAGWAAAFLSGTLAFFQVNSARGADRRLALAGVGTWRVASGRILAALALGVIVSSVAFATLWARSGIEHPWHAAVAIVAFAAIYIGIGAVIGVLVKGSLEGSLLVVLVFAVDVFSGPAMTSGGGLTNLTPTRDAAELLIAAGAGQTSPGSDWISVAVVAAGALLFAAGAFWLSARSRLST